MFVGQIARDHADEVSEQVQRTLANLEMFLASLAGVPGRKGMFTLFVTARESSGDTKPIGRRTIPIHLPSGEVAARGEEYQYVVGMQVGLGPSTISVALRDELGGEVSYLSVEVNPGG